MNIARKESVEVVKLGYKSDTHKGIAGPMKTRPKPTESANSRDGSHKRESSYNLESKRQNYMSTVKGKEFKIQGHTKETSEVLPMRRTTTNYFLKSQNTSTLVHKERELSNYAKTNQKHSIEDKSLKNSMKTNSYFYSIFDKSRERPLEPSRKSSVETSRNHSRGKLDSITLKAPSSRQPSPMLDHASMAHHSKRFNPSSLIKKITNPREEMVGGSGLAMAERKTKMYKKSKADGKKNTFLKSVFS
jgi:hypothetical protein